MQLLRKCYFHHRKSLYVTFKICLQEIEKKKRCIKNIQFSDKHYTVLKMVELSSGLKYTDNTGNKSRPLQI